MAAEDLVEALPLPPGARLLDAGGGDGAFARWLAQNRSLRVTSFDPAVGRSSSVDGVELLPGSFAEWPPSIANDHFDGLMSLDAVQHAADIEQAIAALLTRVRSGPVIITTWSTADVGLAKAWGFEVQPWPRIAAVAREHGLAISASPVFVERIRRQLESLTMMADDARVLFGNTEFDDRVRLERATATAAKSGRLRQAVLRRDAA
jgi:2-polyprenyl-3-methyl-5-hydroxy-6-metoxy-1,4-benzoquinol methylase